MESGTIFIFTIIITFGICVIVSCIVMERLRKLKNQKFREFKAKGFLSTQKYEVGRTLIAIDENNYLWFVMNYNNPTTAKLHKFSDIVDVKIKRQTQNQSRSVRYQSPSVHYFGKIGGSKRVSQSVAIELGVVITLNDLSCPAEYVNCLNYDIAVEKVVALFKAVKAKV